MAKVEIEQFRAHCMKCRVKRKAVGKYVLTENGRGRLAGECSKCGTKVSVMTSKR